MTNQLGALDSRHKVKIVPTELLRQTIEHVCVCVCCCKRKRANVGKVITAENSGRQPCSSKGIFPLRALLQLESRLNRRNPAVDGTVKEDRVPDAHLSKCHPLLSRHFHKHRLIWTSLFWSHGGIWESGSSETLTG